MHTKGFFKERAGVKLLAVTLNNNEYNFFLILLCKASSFLNWERRIDIFFSF